jgi:hypothetical protein
VTWALQTEGFVLNNLMIFGKRATIRGNGTKKRFRKLDMLRFFVSSYSLSDPEHFLVMWASIYVDDLADIAWAFRKAKDVFP